MRIFLIFSLYLFISGCSTRLQYAGINSPENNAPKTAYIVNPELRNELEILEYSGLYKTSTDKNSQIKITLNPIKPMPGCGNAALFSAITLGFIPVEYDEKFEFSFTESKGNLIKTHEYQLENLILKSSNYEWLYFWSSDNEQLGEALHAAAQ